VPDLRSIAARRLTALGHAARNTPLAASVVVRRLAADPVDTAVRIADRLPAPLLARAAT
jgi:hypothetical protein